jgi:serine phosphatase RsbU (regulator of sigma subunit)
MVEMTESIGRASGPSEQDDLYGALRDLADLAWRGVPGCGGASVTLIEQGPRTLAATHAEVRALDKAQYDRDDGPCVTAMRDLVAVTVDDFDTEDRWPSLRDDVTACGVRSSLSIPLEHAGRTLGGLNMYAARTGAFTEESRHAGETFARQAVMLLRSLQQLHSERASHAREHDVAAALQRSLLPTLPTVPGITSSARYLVAGTDARIGGDWYDLFALSDGTVGVAVGDVMGHDLSAAAAMGQLRSVLRSYAYEGNTPARVIERLDRLVQAFNMAQVATAVYGRLLRDRDSAVLSFSNAGHPPPLVRYPDGEVVRVDRAASPLIGALAPGEQRRIEGALTMPAGSLLVLYTDGLVESRKRDIDEGIDLLCAALAGMEGRPEPNDVCDTVLAELVGQSQDDDIALLVIRID